MSKFKVGQKVIAQSDAYVGVTGEIGIVKSRHSDFQKTGYYVEIPVDYQPFTDELYYRENELKEIEE